MQVHEKATDIVTEVRKVISGQDETIEQVLAAILADGHVLIEGLPGLGKTLIVRAFAAVMGLDYGRIQFTPDLMPSDVIGTRVFDPKNVSFELRKGPLFVNVLLADEINRTPPKTQAALLEAMEERAATIDGERHTLPPPFLVFATQNPIELEGTYPLPEAQQDRFLLKIIIRYPSPEDEINVLRRHHAGFRPQKLEEAGLLPVLTPETLAELQADVAKTTVEDKVFYYIASLVQATRNHEDVQVGASPRAGIALLNGSKAIARLRGRDFVIPDDVQALAMPVLRHRVLLRPEAEVEGLTVDQVLSSLLRAQTVPR